MQSMAYQVLSQFLIHACLCLVSQARQNRASEGKKSLERSFLKVKGKKVKKLRSKKGLPHPEGAPVVQLQLHKRVPLNINFFS